MAVPKKRTSRARRDQRRSHDAIKYSAAVQPCTECGELHLRHRVCEACGSYRGRKILNISAEA